MPRRGEMKDNEISTRELEEGKELQLDFKKLEKVGAQSSGVIPVAVQDAETRERLSGITSN
jgi:hypothetical protein